MSVSPQERIEAQRWVQAINKGEYDIPAWGVVEYEGSEFLFDLVPETQPVLKVKRPTGSSLTNVAVNGPLIIGKGCYGAVTFDFPTVALYAAESQTDEPVSGEIWGTENDKFELKKGNAGFRVIGGKQGKNETPGNPKRCWVERDLTAATGGHPFKNGSTETMPAHGVGGITTYDQDLDFLTIEKPSTTFRRFYLVNNENPVLPGKQGTGFLLEAAKVFCGTTLTPVTGESWGAKPDQWYLSQFYYGFTVLGGYNTSTGVAKMQQHAVNKVVGKTDAAIAKGASGAVSVYAGPLGGEADTTQNVTAWNRFASVGSGKWVECTWVGGGWELSAAEC